MKLVNNGVRNISSIVGSDKELQRLDREFRSFINGGPCNIKNILREPEYVSRNESMEIDTEEDEPNVVMKE